MGIRSSIAKAFGSGAGQGNASPPVPVANDHLLSEAEIEASAQASGMDYSRPFSPGQPLRPFDGYSGTPRQHDFITGFNIATRPRINEQVNFFTLKGMVTAYDVAQICIWHRIDSIRSLEWNLQVKKGLVGDYSKELERGYGALRRPDRVLSFKSWLAKYLFDILAYDAGTLHKVRNRVKRPIGLRVIDGTTVAPLLDYWGNRPTGGSPAFVQFAQGIPWEWMKAEDVVYQPFRPQSSSPYGKSPLETILLNANTDLRFQAYFLNRFTEGNVPEGFAGAPEGWNVDQIQAFQATWDAMLYGDDTQKHQVKWVPHGTKFDWTNESEFSDKFSLFLMRKTAAAYHVVPADLGFTEDVNRSSGETQADVQFRVGDLPLIQHVQEIFTQFLQDDMGLPLVFVFDVGQEVQDRLVSAQVHKIHIESGVISPSDIREDVYGLPEPDGRPVPRFIMTQRSGPVPLSALYAVAGPVDSESGAPEPGAMLPKKPFAPIEGVTPQKPPDQPPLAVKLFPQENQASAQAAAVAAEAPVLKADTVGVTTDTGTYGSPMLEEEEVKKELATFHRFTKARRKAGNWRDFEFTQVPAREAQALNRSGRIEIRKSRQTGEPIAAGLAVVAEDTGRVLMLERGEDPLDPTSQTWEFPGGHLEPGEQPFDAAVREWQEETGFLLPASALNTRARSWYSDDGVYQGFVLCIPCEADFPPYGFRGRMNPDDPDSDVVEDVAWWEPRLLMISEDLRPELRRSIDKVLPLLRQLVTKAAAWEDKHVRGLEPQHARNIAEATGALYDDSAIRSLVSKYLAAQR